ncbi:MAG: hypothetical protein AAGJ40_03160 [Planctomycetota bacterium]
MRSILTISILLMVCGVPCFADIVIDIGNPVLLPDTPDQVISIQSSGGEQVAGVNFNLQIDPVVGVSPEITGLDIVGPGTIFTSSNTGQTGTTIGELDPINLASFQFALASATTTSGTVSSDGVLGFVTLDTTGIFGGSFVINMDSTFNGPTDFAPTPVNTFLGGSLTVAAIPEPSSFTWMASAASLVLLTRYRRASHSGNTSSA